MRGPPRPQPAPARPDEPASFGGGRYEVQGFLGKGGRKSVYLARDARLGRQVAVSVVDASGLDELTLARVRREAAAMAGLGDHTNIVTIYDIGEEHGREYIVSQYMAGGSVADLLDGAEGHRLPIEQALRIAEEICRALDYAHRRGIVHRDLKPANVRLTDEGTAKLGDFGLAVGRDRAEVTSEGAIVGTVGYMPPEQALGREEPTRAATSTRWARCSTRWSAGDRRSSATTRSRSSVSTSTRSPSRPPGTTRASRPCWRGSSSASSRRRPRTGRRAPPP